MKAKIINRRRVIPIRYKEFLKASRWYFVGPPARRAGRRPKPLSSFRGFLIANGIKEGSERVYGLSEGGEEYKPPPYNAWEISAGEAGKKKAHAHDSECVAH
jgi:hypothetical protein